MTIRVQVALVLVLLTLAVVQIARGGQSTDPSCWFDPATITAGETTTLRATGLPTDLPVGITLELYPTGNGLIYPTGMLAYPLTPSESVTAYLWVRGRGKSLIKPGAKLNDYHVIAMCSLAVST